MSNGTLTPFKADRRDAKSARALQQEAVAAPDVEQRRFFRVKHKFSQNVPIVSPVAAFVMPRILFPPSLQSHVVVNHTVLSYLHRCPTAISLRSMSRYERYAAPIAARIALIDTAASGAVSICGGCLKNRL